MSTARLGGATLSRWLVTSSPVGLSCRRYGLVGRNGTGKTTLLRALSGHQIRGTPPALQILHVEQEVRD